MKKLIAIGIVLALLTILIAVPVAARCELPCCCVEYCNNLTFDYEVKFKVKVESGFFTPWGTPMYCHVWTTVIVEDVHNADEAADFLGLREGYECWISKVS